MLFKFNKFWKTISILLGGWAFYGLCGYEMTVVTLLCLFLAVFLKDNAQTP